MRSRTRALCTAAVASLALVPLSSTGDAATPRRFVTGWIPAWAPSSITAGTANLAANASIINDAMPFAFQATSATRITPSGTRTDLDNAIAAVRAARLPVIPSITDGTAKNVMAAILDDPTRRAIHEDAIVTLVTTNGYDGIDLDYEGFAFVDGRSTWPATSTDWQAFIASLGTKLRARGKLLSVTVPPIWTTSLSSPGYTVYAPVQILPNIDRLRLMVYDWSTTSAGPIAPMTWVNDVITTMNRQVPVDQRSKIQLGVPTYGKNWARVTSGTCPAGTNVATTSILMRTAPSLATARSATPVRHSSGEMTFSYTQTFTGPPANVAVPAYTPPTTRAGSIDVADGGSLQQADRLNTVTCVVTRTVFFPDAQSVKDRAEAAIAAGWGGIAIWALGYESADLWPTLQSIAPAS